MQWPCMLTYITYKHYQYNRRKPTLKLSYPLNSQMSAPINTTKYLIGKSPYGNIRAKLEYTHEKITLTLFWLGFFMYVKWLGRGKITPPV